MDPRADSAVRERIARKAYDLYQQRGWTDGHDLDDWFEAERIVLSELSAAPSGEAAVGRTRSKAPAAQSRGNARPSQSVGS
jgi:hypothetical protein